MEKPNTNWYSMSDPAILQELGHFIQQIRLQQNRTQQQIATAAGIKRSTLIQIENGAGGTLLSFIQVIRVLEQLHLLKHFEVSQQASPLQLAKLEQKKRQRASAKAVVAFNPVTKEIRSGQADAPKGFSHWLLKFDGVTDQQLGTTSGYGRVEMAYHLMAREAEIEMSECRLPEENERAHFMTRRFDRNAVGRWNEFVEQTHVKVDLRDAISNTPLLL